MRQRRSLVAFLIAIGFYKDRPKKPDRFALFPSVIPFPEFVQENPYTVLVNLSTCERMRIMVGRRSLCFLYVTEGIFAVLCVNYGLTRFYKTTVFLHL